MPNRAGCQRWAWHLLSNSPQDSKLAYFPKCLFIPLKSISLYSVISRPVPDTNMQITQLDNKARPSVEVVTTQQRLMKQYDPRDFILRCTSTTTCSNLVVGGGVQAVANNSCQMCSVPRAHAHSHRQWNACEEPQQEVRSGLLPPPLKA